LFQIVSSQGGSRPGLEKAFCNRVAIALRYISIYGSLGQCMAVETGPCECANLRPGYPERGVFWHYPCKGCRDGGWGEAQLEVPPTYTHNEKTKVAARSYRSYDYGSSYGSRKYDSSYGFARVALSAATADSSSDKTTTPHFRPPPESSTISRTSTLGVSGTTSIQLGIK
jgi:hypothetical protein